MRLVYRHFDKLEAVLSSATNPRLDLFVDQATCRYKPLQLNVVALQRVVDCVAVENSPLDTVAAINKQSTNTQK